MTKEKSQTDKAKVTKTERADVLILHPVTFYKCVQIHTIVLKDFN